ncbi:DUF4328 domain-containing protein [Gordonia sp. (in: high G+C Gram-positive bacteria)]|uniref:DUF4328 domain-containing protein n=1 Tax=Gordonia sp. (in: high G+C Gram-positive bacteria) TaxID=84139 RepID=UPI002624CBF0|nr:DUF4328 domain-containing protein [Gordonia sp. (in: high G+C Gram-positive bacteria)]
MMLDVCLSCRIQAEHQPGRATCPRCGRPLTVLDETTRRPVAGGPAPAPAAAAAPTPAVRRTPTRPTPPRLRWVAHRPADTLPPRPSPAPRRRTVPARYGQIPRWGLFDVVAPPAEEAGTDPAASLRRWLTFLWPFLVAAAVMQLLRYVTLMVNRSRPIPAWWDLGTLALVMLCGWVAAAGVVVGLYYFTRWMIQVRADSYALAGRSDPRPAWAVLLMTALIFVNVVGAPFALVEAARAAGGPGVARVERAVRRVAVAWGLVNLIGAIALAYRIACLFTDSVQTGADAMAWATLAFAASAVFARWLGPRLDKVVVTGDEVASAPPRRLVVAA